MALASPHCHRIYYTDVMADFKCDTFLPEIDTEVFKEIRLVWFHSSSRIAMMLRSLPSHPARPPTMCSEPIEWEDDHWKVLSSITAWNRKTYEAFSWESTENKDTDERSFSNQHFTCFQFRWSQQRREDRWWHSVQVSRVWKGTIVVGVSVSLRNLRKLFDLPSSCSGVLLWQ